MPNLAIYGNMYPQNKTIGGLKMENSLKLMISGEKEEFSREICSEFEQMGFHLIFAAKNGLTVLEKIPELQPDIVLMDIFMPSLDAIGVMNAYEKKEEAKKPLFVVVSNFTNPMLEKEVITAGAGYFVIRPFQAHALAERMIRLCGIDRGIPEKAFPTGEDTLSLKIQVTEILHQIGVPAHIKGYQYLRDSIIMAIENPDIINAITKQLYPSVAKRYETTSSRVERAIRHAIEVAWDRGDVDVLNSYFGYTIHNTRGKPTNSEFVAMISDKLRLKMKNAS